MLRLSVMNFYRSSVEQVGWRRRDLRGILEPVDLKKSIRAVSMSLVGIIFSYLDGLGVEFQPFLFVDQELLHILTLIALKLDHLAHFGVVDDGAIAS